MSVGVCGPGRAAGWPPPPKSRLACHLCDTRKQVSAAKLAVCMSVWRARGRWQKSIRITRAPPVSKWCIKTCKENALDVCFCSLSLSLFVNPHPITQTAHSTRHYVTRDQDAAARVELSVGEKRRWTLASWCFPLLYMTRTRVFFLPAKKSLWHLYIGFNLPFLCWIKLCCGGENKSEVNFYKNKAHNV